MRENVLRVCSLTHKLLSYAPSLQLQEQLLQQRKAGHIPDTILILQHTPVFTIGKRGSVQDFHTTAEELSQLNIEAIRIPRGGETTYHGPGQLVAYPIMDLRQMKLGARAYVESLEQAMIQTVGCYGIQARGQVLGKTGVWVGDRKIGAVGVRITHGITSHGIALNVKTDLNIYRHIVPCGTPDKEVTSIEAELQRPLWRKQSSSNSSSEAQQYREGQQVGAQQVSVDVAVAEQHLLQAFVRVFRPSDLHQVTEGQLLSTATCT